MTQSHTNQEKYRRFRIRTENTAILLLAVFSLFLFVLTFFPLSRLSQHMQASIEMGRMVQRAFSMILFFLSVQLWKRKRNAWFFAMGIFVLNFLRGLVGMGHPLHNGLMIFDLLLFLSFVFCSAQRFLLPCRTGQPQTDISVCSPGCGRCSWQCGDHLALYAPCCLRQCIRLPDGQLRTGNRHDPRHVLSLIHI